MHPLPRRMVVSVLLASSAAGYQLASFDDELARAIEVGRRAMVEHMLDTGLAPGSAVGVAIGGRVVWEEGFGLADLEHDVAVGTHTRFGLGSVSKVLTMTCAQRLAERGLLDLDAPVERYLTEFPFAGEGITIRRLAAHQSGLTDDLQAHFDEVAQHFPTIEAAYTELVAGEDLASAPGTEVAYANGTFTVIARAMEVVSGESYVELMQKHVLGPAGMERTTPDVRRHIVPGRSGFYQLISKGSFEHARHRDASFKLPAAGWLSTAGDVARFGAALLGGDLLGPQARREFLSTVPLADGTPTEYALGLRYTEDEGMAVWHHPGGGPGISCWIVLYPEQELSIAILSNCNQGPVGGPVLEVLTEHFVRVAELGR